MVCGVVGLGLIGGSFALATRDYFEEIVGVDINPSHQELALRLGLVDQIVRVKDLKGVDFIALAIPVKGILKVLEELAQLGLPEGTTIVDFGSTKERIVLSCPREIRPQLVASHPMAGKEYSGPLAAIPDLFQNRIIVICNPEESGKVHLDRALEVYDHLQMEVVYMDARDHDRHAAFISHMPHLVSFAIANSVLAQEDREAIVALAASGFKSMSRLAKSNPRMWSDIFQENRENLLKAVEAFQGEWERARQLIQEERWQELEEWMWNGNRLSEIM
jgi:prephenate dehydrogenase